MKLKARVLLENLSRLLLVLCLCVATTAMAQVTPKQIRADFRAWQFDQSRENIATLAAATPDDPEVLFLQGRQAFYEGRYQVALDLIDAAIPGAVGRRAASMASLRDLVASTLEVSKDYEVVTSPDGRFELRYPPGKDRVLVPFAFDALSAAYDAMEADFGVTPQTPVRVEIYPTAADLARVSPLTVEEIETSGTIALCKYNRLMLTSPKALARGYGWLDTLSHEYVHMIINIAGKGRVPIWMHEGLAKFSERRWRGGDSERRISPYSEHLLYERANKGEIVSFDQMHPSMAKLPSQEETAMAFAEVFAAMELIHLRHGTAGLRSFVDRVGRGEEVEAALSGVLEMPFEGFLEIWRQHLVERERHYTGDEPPDYHEQITFKKRAAVDSPDDIELIPEERARRHVHLGQLLRAKSRPKAAVVQYRKASRLLGETNPILQARLGRALLDMGEVEHSIKAMQAAVDDGEEYGALYVYLGEALTQARRWEEARATLIEAAAINPFDPSIHVALSLVYGALGAPARADIAREHAALLKRR